MGHTKPIKDYGGYDIADNGDVFSVHFNWRGYGKRKLVQHPNSYGYMRVRLQKGDIRRNLLVHTLVLQHFAPAKPSLHYEARHLNGNKRDNRITNLTWGTAMDNAKDRERHGHTSQGERHSVAIRNGLKRSQRVRLIAAAPALLEAAKDLVDAHTKKMGRSAVELRYKLAQDAIAHAEGKNNE